VAFVAASLVGPDGCVVGVDSSTDALARARLRAAQRGLTQVQFVEGDIRDPAPGGPFDAIVERLALWLVPDTAEVLRRQATVLRPGGLVVPIEYDLSMSRSLPENASFTQVNSWLIEAFARAGLVMLGPRLWAIVQEAGLRPVGMIGIQPHFGPGDEVGLAYWVESMRAAAPLIVGTGVATAEEIGMETFEQGVRDEVQGNPALVALLPYCSARGRQPARSSTGNLLTWQLLTRLLSWARSEGLEAPTFRSVDSCPGIQTRSDQSVTSGSSLPVVRRVWIVRRLFIRVAPSRSPRGHD
jgi:hypothetical protein